MLFEKIFSISRTSSSQHRPFKPCTGHTRSGNWLRSVYHFIFSPFSAGKSLEDRYMWCNCFWPTDVWGKGPGSPVALPSPDWLKIYSDTDTHTQNKEFHRQKCVIWVNASNKISLCATFQTLWVPSSLEILTFRRSNLHCSPFGSNWVQLHRAVQSLSLKVIITFFWPA